MSRSALLRAGWIVALGAQACGPTEAPERVERARQAVVAPLSSAFCDIRIVDTGVDVTVPAESDYLPHVIQCENGGAGIEALKAQAIAARSVAYYNMATQGSICDSQGCQVYSCGSTPRSEHFQAVAETSGLYLSYDSMLTYGFYVDGDHGTSGPTCVGSATSGNAGASRERWVTYNDGKTGADVGMTPLGFIPTGQPVFGQNRGCMGQWGARCLENALGRDHLGILRFYYGADIEVRQAPGPCVEPLDRAPEGALDPASCDALTGWAWDPDDPGGAVDVLLSVDLPPDAPGSAPVTVTADEYRGDLCSTLGSCGHGFRHELPAWIRDGATHTLHARAVDPGGGAARDLAGSPRAVLCSPTPDPDGAAGGPGADAGPADAAAGPPTESGGAAGAGAPGQGGGVDASPRSSEKSPADPAGCTCRAPAQPAGRPPLPVALALLAVRWRRSSRRHSS